MNDRIDIVVAEDEYLTLEGICSILSKAPDFNIAGKATSGAQAIEMAEACQPTVLLLDIRMPPGIDGIEVIKQLRRKKVPVAIIALTQEYRLIKAVQDAGANGYLPKEDHRIFIPTIRCVVQTGSEVFINPKVSQQFQEMQKRVDQAQLSPLELSAWTLMSYKNDEISRRLNKSPGRIRNLITDLYFKLDIQDQGPVSRRVQAMEMARLLGILERPDLT